MCLQWSAICQIEAFSGLQALKSHYNHLLIGCISVTSFSLGLCQF